MTTEQFIIEVFNQSFKKYFYDNLIIGKLAHTEFKSDIKKGDEIDVIMPAKINLFDYTGGNIKDYETPENSTTKVRIDKGKAFHFEINEIKKRMIDNCKDVGQKVNLAKEYTSDAIKQFDAAVDEAYGALYTRAGVKACDAPTEFDKRNARQLFAYMQTLYKRGDKDGHNNWIDGSMLCIVPPEVQFYLGQLDDLQYVESGHKIYKKGYMGTIAGWDILVSNNVAQTVTTDGKTVFHPLFGIRGKTLAGGVSKDLNTKSYEPELNFNTRYKGYGLYGVGAPRADFLGTAPLLIDAKFSAPEDKTVTTGK